MNFAQSFLPTTPARWVIVNGSMTENEILLAPNGSATIDIRKEDILNVPEAMLLTILADNYTDPYKPLDTVEVIIKGKNEEYIQFYCPLVNSGNDIYSTILQASQMDYVDFTVAIKSKNGIRITDWNLSGPSEGDNTQVIEEIRGELPKLLFDYNTARFDIGQMETTIALISANLLKNTDLNGHIQLTYNASEDATLIIRVKDNEISELFTPILYDVKQGRGSIGIPHAYLEKFVGIHTFTVTAQVTSGSLFFDVRSILYTIDGGHLAQRIMDVGMDVRDIVMRRRPNESDPSWIYAIGIDDGQAMVRSRPYSDVTSTVWEPNAILGEAVECAIEFEGEWVMKDAQYRFETDEDPWTFWIDSTNRLWGQYFNETATKVQLASNAIKLSAVKGYRNNVFVQNDHGLVVAYIKGDGLVYYRNYCKLGKTKVWESERVIEEFTGTAIKLTTFRTNDYRIGFNIEEAGEITTTLLTSRNWAGIAIRPDTIAVSPVQVIADLIPLEYIDTFVPDETLSVSPIAPEAILLYGDTNNIISSVINIPTTKLDELEESYEDWGWAIELDFAHPIPNLPLVRVITTNLDNGTIVEMTNIEKVSSTRYRLSVSDVVESGINNVYGDIKVSVTGATNPAGYTYIDMVETFTPINLVPVDIPLPEVLEVRNE